MTNSANTATVAEENSGEPREAGSPSAGFADCLTVERAQALLDTLLQGQPPPADMTDLISVGLDKHIETFVDEYFGPDGLLPKTEQGSFKIVEAYYGGGKSHYLRAVQAAARRNGFATCWTDLHKDTCPLTRFDLVFYRAVNSLQVPESQTGIENVLRWWVVPGDPAADPIEYAEAQLTRLGDLPLPSLRVALETAARAIASNDRATLDEALAYLREGRIAPNLRRRGVLSSIDVRNGVIALRSLAVWLRHLGVRGLALVLDEGDRSLSIASERERTQAANNMVQIINEVHEEGMWPGSLILYSIPSWQDFQNNLSRGNMALEQRVRGTGFPNVPPAPRIRLDEQYPDDDARIGFCLELAPKLHEVFVCRYPSERARAGEARGLAERVARAVVRDVIDVSFRRLFVQSFIAALYLSRRNVALSDDALRSLVQGEADRIRQAGS